MFNVWLNSEDKSHEEAFSTRANFKCFPTQTLYISQYELKVCVKPSATLLFTVQLIRKNGFRGAVTGNNDWKAYKVSFRFCGAATNYNSTRRIKTQCLLCIKMQNNTRSVQWFEEVWLVATGASMSWKVESHRCSVCKRKITPLPNLDGPAHLVQPAEGDTSPTPSPSPSPPSLYLFTRCGTNRCDWKKKAHQTCQTGSC